MKEGEEELEVSLSGMIIQVEEPLAAEEGRRTSDSTPPQEEDSKKQQGRRLLPIAALLLIIVAVSITMGTVLSKNKNSSKSSTIQSNRDGDTGTTAEDGENTSTNYSTPGNPVDATYAFHVDPVETFSPSASSQGGGGNRDSNAAEKTTAPTAVASEEPTSGSTTAPPTQSPTKSPSGTPSSLPSATNVKYTISPTPSNLTTNWTRNEQDPPEDTSDIDEPDPDPKPVDILRLTCPTEAESSLEFALRDADATANTKQTADFWIELTNSSPDTLCTLVQVGTNSEGSFIMPIARSYSGHNWEVTAGKYKDYLPEITCQQDVCHLNLNVVDTPSEAVFQLTTFGRQNYTQRDEIARFLEQTTFGPTTELLDEIEENAQGKSLQTSFANWIHTQMKQVPILSHRALYRKHLNARFNVPSPIGTVTQPCEAGTRYRRVAFAEKDIDRSLDIIFTTEEDIVLSVDGQVRTVVPAPLYYWGGDAPVEQNWPEGSHRICWVYYDGERSGISVEHPDHSNECLGMMFIDPDLSNFLCNEYWTNPPILGIETLVSYSEQLSVLDVPLESATVMDGEYFPSDAMPDQLEIILLKDLDDKICESLGAADSEHPVFAMWDDNYYIHDPRFHLLQNTAENPLPDGGGATAAQHSNLLLDDFSTMCANAPRTFLNEDKCILSYSPNACRYRTTRDDTDIPEAWFEVSHETLQRINEATEGEETPTYLYAIEGLDVKRDASAASPCTPGQQTRWINVDCSNVDEGISAVTKNLLSLLLQWHDEEAEASHLVDMWHPHRLETSCDAADMEQKGFEVEDHNREGRCWRNVHPDLLNVYDFGGWVANHPGNSEARNPIEEVANAGNTTLLFPSWHEMSRWQNVKDQFPGPVRLGDDDNFFDLPVGLRTKEIAMALGIDLDKVGSADGEGGFNSGSTMVCGSPYEIANDPFLGGSVWKGAFDAATKYLQSTPFEDLVEQRKTVWTKAALEDPGQLRQRAAWALSQILVISPGSIDEGEYLTESFLMFYDIMLRHAFGNYRDILKEVSYSPMMADMLTYYGGRSTAHVWHHEGNIEFADENFSREILQLFTTGAFTRLHMNGTARVNEKGEHERVYSSSEIEEYARAWTGFVSQEGRGNFEYTYTNRIDPMRIDEEWRDRFPKMGLDGLYVGDGFPLCADLPDKHFLLKGATYKLLGSKSVPELQMDPEEWRDEDSVERLSLDVSSSLYKALCGTSDGTCAFASLVVLDESLQCSGRECFVNTVRTVEVSGVFYEYAREPCVFQAFVNESKTIVPRWDWHDVMCADPRTESGTVGCCSGSDWSMDKWNEEYFGERVAFATAERRCGGEDQLCARHRRPSCDEDDQNAGSRCYDNNYFWTTNSCGVKAKIDRASGKVGIVHEPEGIALNETAYITHADTKTFFGVDWEGDYEAIVSDCGALGPCVWTEDDACLCEVSVVEEQVFSGTSLPSRSSVLSSLYIGAFEQYGKAIEASAEGVNVYNLGNDGQLQPDSVFEVVDNHGRNHLRKNVKSTVLIQGTDVSFRNPVHFMSLSDPEPRDARYETDATLDHYIYHQNTAPFLAIRFAQRFGISNPSPRYVEQISTAFVSGSYAVDDADGVTLEFGSGKYGDLEATFACVLLDREARDSVLDNDPAHGSLKEPLIKVLGIMRAFRFQPHASHPWVQFDRSFGGRVGQMAHEIPSVFSFFLPEFQPYGPVAQGGLVAPEAQVLTGPRAINSLNGIFALLKYGLNDCLGGFGLKEIADCNSVGIGKREGTGELTYAPEAEAEASPYIVVKELSTLLTAGRLGPENQRIIEQAYSEGGEHALLKAQLLMATAPEFHVTNIIRQSGIKRPNLPASAAPSKPYKAVVYILLQGGVDSFNMLAPHTCSAVNSNGMSLLEQYNAERTTLAFTDEERHLIIDAQGQPCDQFAIHPDLPLIERLYKQGELSFFANVGQLDMPVTKDNYWMSRSDLFAHNTMQRQAQRIDPWDKSPNTGILGRMCDVLLQRGCNCQSITVDDATVATVGGIPGTSVSPLIVSPTGLDKFAPMTRSEELDLNEFVGDLINATSLHSSVFGETWARTLRKGIVDAAELTDAIDNVTLTQSYPIDTENDYVQRIRALASLILTQDKRNAERDVFFLSLGDWDHHEALKPSLSQEFTKLNQALTLLEGELKSQGIWDQVSVVVTSDFARTLTANSGEGSDHAWGGIYFLLSGSLKGGQIHGNYPADITLNGPLNVGRGRLIPTLSWESMLTSVIQWMGVEEEDDLDYCMPNRHRTETTLFDMNEVFAGRSLGHG